MKFNFLTLILIIFCFNSTTAQQIDSIQKPKGEYPYVLPILGQKVYDRGYDLPLPFNVSVGTVFNKQGIVLDQFQLAFTQNDAVADFEQFQPIADLVEFGPSDGRVNTLFARGEASVFPFLNVGLYYGKVWGKQTIRLNAPVEITSDTDINGVYYGFNLIGFAPVGPIILQADYSRSWTTNDRLDKPVNVNVSGMRAIKRFINKKNPEKYLAVWGGAQYQNLEGQTSGNINLGKALNITEETINGFESAWDDYTMSPAWDELTLAEKAKQTTAYNLTLAGLNAVDDTTVHYKFNKSLEYPWSMLLGFQYAFNNRWSVRAEYSFLRSKQQLFANLVYYFGI